MEWKAHYEGDGCHVRATPRLEGEDVARRMWGAALNWTIAREGDGYTMALRRQTTVAGLGTA